ncbi:MAG: S-layer homology domain-containing protein [Tepidanaerobacteraceae bacterium]|nr:S-layer homology domain-containing protein [Tepidanaerobacteraceae bacterium]
MRKIKKAWSIILTVALLLTMAPNGYGAADSGQGGLPFSDIQGHWAEKTIIEHASKGFLKGYPDGTFRPDQGMRRCELVSLINRYFGLIQQSRNNFEDVKGTEWYAPDTARARYYGYLDGLKARPEEFATRGDVVQMVSLLLDLAEQERIKQGTDFSDIGDLDEGIKEDIQAFSQMGYLQGYPDGTFRPDRIINRAEIMTIAQNVLGYIVTSQEDLENIPDDVKKITIIKPDIVIKDKEIKADLYITPGVAGNITIQNSTIKGKLEIGGGSAGKPILLENVTADKLIITRAKEEPRLEIESSNIKELKIKSTAKINTDSKTTIVTAKISAGVRISGEGKIKKAYIDADDVKLEKKPEYTEILGKNIVVNIGGEQISQSNADQGSSTRRKSSSGSSSGNQTPQLISITGVEITGTATVGEAVYAAVYPSGATAVYRWQRSNGADYEDIEGAVESSYVLTEEDEGKQIRVVVEGTGSYKGTAASGSIGPIDPFLISVTGVEITGTAIVGETVYAEVKPSGATVTYKWQRGKRADEFADIAGATGPSYTLTEEDSDTKIRVIVTGTGNYTGTAISDPIGRVTVDPVTAKIREGWIPIANKEELKQIENPVDNTFGAGTRWEGTYTGGMDKKYMLVADIDLAGDNFESIGYFPEDTMAIDFTGIFSGQGHKIMNLTIDDEHEPQGLFSSLGEGALIEDLTLEDVNITAFAKFGAVAGTATGARIENCTVRNAQYDIVDMAYKWRFRNPKYIGGFVGKSENTYFKNLELDGLSMISYRTGDFDTVPAVHNVGGITGLLDGGGLADIRVKNIHIEAVNEIDEDSSHNDDKMLMFYSTGGVAGELQNSSADELDVDNCVVSGLEIIAGDSNSIYYIGSDGKGGVIGVIDTSQFTDTQGDIVIKDSTVQGIIQGKGKGLATEKVGGFIGYADGTNTHSGYITIENCSASVDINNLDIDSNVLDVYLTNGPAGGFASKLIKTWVTNCHAHGNLDSAFLGGGGFAGWIVDSHLDLCSAEGDVLGLGFISGFSLFIEDSSNVTRCYASGLVGGNDAPEQLGDFPWNAAGFAARVKDSTLRNNYFAGKMEESRDIEGGAGWGAGFIYEASNVVIQNAYVSGDVANNLGFAFEVVDGTEISGCYYNTTENPSTSAVFNIVGATVDIEGKTEAELKQIGTFDGWSISEEGSGENTLWYIKEGEKYPFFNPDYVPSR